MIVLFIVLFIFLMVIIAIVVLAGWGFSLANDAVWLSFNSFRKFYEIAPEKYELHSDSITYNTKTRHWEYINMKTPIDYARYWLWWKKKTRQGRKIDNVKRTQEYIDCVRKDLEKFMKDKGE